MSKITYLLRVYDVCCIVPKEKITWSKVGASWGPCYRAPYLLHVVPKNSSVFVPIQFLWTFYSNVRIMLFLWGGSLLNNLLKALWTKTTDFNLLNKSTDISWSENMFSIRIKCLGLYLWNSDNNETAVFQYRVIKLIIELLNSMQPTTIFRIKYLHCYMLSKPHHSFMKTLYNPQQKGSQWEQSKTVGRGTKDL